MIFILIKGRLHSTKILDDVELGVASVGRAFKFFCLFVMIKSMFSCSKDYLSYALGTTHHLWAKSLLLQISWEVGKEAHIKANK